MLILVMEMRIPQHLRERRYLFVMFLTFMIVFIGVAFIGAGFLSYEGSLYRSQQYTEFRNVYLFEATLPANHLYHVSIDMDGVSYIHVRVFIVDQTQNKILLDETREDADTGRKDDASISIFLELQPIEIDRDLSITVNVLPDTQGIEAVIFRIYQDPPDPLPLFATGGGIATLGFILAFVFSKFDIVTKHSASLLKAFTMRCNDCGLPLLPDSKYCPNCRKQVS